MGAFWNIVLDKNKQLFVNNKFLTSASENGKFIFKKTFFVCL